MKVKIVNKSKHDLPHYATNQSAGMDLRANLEDPIVLKTLERTLVKTGLFIELPVGYEAQVRPRSGLAYKKGITVLNSPGTIDADYRGEIGVILVNLSEEEFLIENGDYDEVLEARIYVSGVQCDDFPLSSETTLSVKRNDCSWSDFQVTLSESNTVNGPYIINNEMLNDVQYLRDADVTLESRDALIYKLQFDTTFLKKCSS